MEKRSGSPSHSITFPQSGKASAMEKRSGSPSQLITFPQKKQRSENPQSGKVGVFCFSLEPEEEDIKVYVLDLDLDGSRDGGDEYKEIEPAYHLRLPREYETHALCVKGSTLYVFEGENTFSLFPPPNPNRKTVRKLVLPPEVLAGGKVVKGVVGDVKKVSDMKHIKHNPKAILTPDAQQILVFSTEFYSHHFDDLDDASPRNAFELYDIGSDSWVTLPGLPLTPSRAIHPKRTLVTSFTFTDHSHFLLCTDNKGGFLLNFKSKEWTKLDVGDAFRCFVDYFVMLCSGRSALFPRKLHQTKDDRKVFEYRRNWDDSGSIETFPFPLSKLPPNNDSLLLKEYHWYHLFPPSLVPLQPDVFSIQEHEWCLTCTLQSQYFAHLPDGERVIRLLIDVRRIHLTSHDTQALNTVKASIGHKGIITILKSFPLPLP